MLDSPPLAQALAARLQELRAQVCLHCKRGAAMIVFTIIGMVVVAYLAVGLLVGIWDVYRHLARFFSAGFQWRRMLEHALTIMVLWPLLFGPST
jgi:hypothetical protein